MNKTDWFGYEQLNFEVGGRESFIVCPKTPMNGNPWVWRTEFFGAFDTVDRALLEKGYFLAYHRVSDMYGNPESVEMLHEFYLISTNEYKLSKKPVLFGFSRGGLYAVNFAAKYPDCTGELYLDAPVTDIRSWPGSFTESAEWKQCLECYGLTNETAKQFSQNPNDFAEKNAKDGIPVIIVAGDSDSVVPFSQNGSVYFKNYKKYSDTIESIVKPGCDHHPHSPSDPAPVVDFIEKYAAARGVRE